MKPELLSHNPFPWHVQSLARGPILARGYIYMARGSITKIYYLWPASLPPLQFLFSPHGGVTVVIR